MSIKIVNIVFGSYSAEKMKQLISRAKCVFLRIYVYTPYTFGFTQLRLFCHCCSIIILAVNEIFVIL